jgi:hypothetical protein
MDLVGKGAKNAPGFDYVQGIGPWSKRPADHPTFVMPSALGAF